MAERHNAQLETHLYTLLRSLLNAVADQERQNALGLVILDHLGHGGSIVRLAQHNRNAGDIARYKRHAEGANDGIGHEADAGFIRIRIRTAQILQALDDFRTDGCGQTGVERLTEILLIRDQALQNADTGGQVAQRLDLHARSGIDCREKVSGVRKCNGGIGAMLCDGVVHRALGQARNGVGTGIDQICQCAHE